MMLFLKRNGKRFPSVWLSYNCESNFGMNPFTSGTLNKFLGQLCGIDMIFPVCSIIIEISIYYGDLQIWIIRSQLK